MLFYAFLYTLVPQWVIVNLKVNICDEKGHVYTKFGEGAQKIESPGAFCCLQTMLDMI